MYIEFVIALVVAAVLMLVVARIYLYELGGKHARAQEIYTPALMQILEVPARETIVAATSGHNVISLTEAREALILARSRRSDDTVLGVRQLIAPKSGGTDAA